MSVSMIENWADILGLVQAVGQDSELQDFDSVELLVEQVIPVEGYPNLVETYLEEEAEPRLVVLMPVEMVTTYEITPGVVVECRVRRAGMSRMFVHSDYVVVRKPE